MDKNTQVPPLSQTNDGGSGFLAGKAQKDFWDWYLLPETLQAHKLSGMFKFSNGNVIKVNFLAESEVCQNALITEWFDSVGITVDVMPRMADENKILFEPNTFCLKHEIVTEDFLQFETRQDAIRNAIIQANLIYNIHFIDTNKSEN
jgi:hypothetical protein